MGGTWGNGDLGGLGQEGGHWGASHLGLIGGGNFQVATSYLLAKWTPYCREELCYELAI